MRRAVRQQVARELGRVLADRAGVLLAVDGCYMSSGQLRARGVCLKSGTANSYRADPSPMRECTSGSARVLPLASRPMTRAGARRGLAATSPGDARRRPRRRRGPGRGARRGSKLACAKARSPRSSWTLSDADAGSSPRADRRLVQRRLCISRDVVVSWKVV